MSRIGKKPIQVPGGVKIEVKDADRTIGVSGPKGSLDYVWHGDVSVSYDESDSLISCQLADESQLRNRSMRAMSTIPNSKLKKVYISLGRNRRRLRATILTLRQNALPSSETRTEERPRAVFDLGLSGP